MSEQTYRGITYVVFDNLPLEKFDNSAIIDRAMQSITDYFLVMRRRRVCFPAVVLFGMREGRT